MRILLATDASQGALAAARFIRDNHAADADVDLLYVARNPLEYFPDMTFQYDTADWERDVRSAAQDVFAKTRDALSPLVPREELLQHGHPAATIAEFGQRYDLIVVGKRRRQSFSRLVLGSVSAHLAHVLEQPLLIV